VSDRLHLGERRRQVELARPGTRRDVGEQLVDRPDPIVSSIAARSASVLGM